MYPFIEKLAVPDQQASLKNAFASSGPYMAQIWGYAGTEDAKTKAFYNIRTERYKVLSKDADDAVISLYAITHWVTAANEEYRVPSLSSVKMRLVGKNWLYVQAETPPANQLPQLPAQQLEYAELVGLYQPLLKGYSFYDPPEL